MGLWGAGTLVCKRAWRHAWEGRDEETFRARAVFFLFFLNPSCCILNQIQSLMLVMLNRRMSRGKPWCFRVTKMGNVFIWHFPHSFKLSKKWSIQRKKLNKRLYICWDMWPRYQVRNTRGTIFNRYSLTVSLKVFKNIYWRSLKRDEVKDEAFQWKCPRQSRFSDDMTLVFPQQLWITALKTKHHLGAYIHFCRLFFFFFSRAACGSSEIEIETCGGGINCIVSKLDEC